jgi:ribulose-5-phosphate 4-epimerase/fuculose-1-phosphate aldolase
VSETGSVKFACEHVAVELASFAAVGELNACRRMLLQLRLIGVDENGIGFGNVSIRDGATKRFHITGSGTGRLPALTLRDYARVTAYDIDRNWLRCEGATIASSESLTHAAIYEADANINAVIHGHSAALWAQLRRYAASTSAEVEYGTPAMAREVQRLFRETDVRDRRVFAMAGHEAGVVAFGATVDDALASLLRLV